MLLQQYGGPLKILLGDGWKGLPSEGPFSAIHVGAAAEEIPIALVEQLARPGRLIVPVGPTFGSQDLLMIEKDVEGNVKVNQISGVRYVPLVRK
jgi:protein-L-isoaspartate(D-aspartate) O-methyltransferase